MNRIDKLFKEKKDILSVYFTAGHPEIDSMRGIIKTLEEAGADLIEIGIPFSDPMADGPVLQRSNQKALQNGMSLKLLFEQLENIRDEVKIPLILMGYLNPVIQFGVEKFCEKCRSTGIDGVIIPDLPPSVYTNEYHAIFNEYMILNILLITPQSSPERISYIDSISRGFIYMVSSSATTGGKGALSDNQVAYFRRIKEMNLKNPSLIGFGISDRDTFQGACKYSQGGIIGSAFVSCLEQTGGSAGGIREFIKSIES